MRFVQSSMVLLFVLTLAADMLAQKEDYHWCLGYNGESSNFNPPFGGVNFLFKNDSILIEYAERAADFDDCNSSISDKNGNLVLFTNGIYAGNGANQIVNNGRGLDAWSDNGNQARQGSLILPLPGAQQDTFIIIHNSMDIVFVNARPLVAIFQVFASYADIAYNNGQGQLYSKKEVIVDDTIKWGITAVRHANGRDWWMPIIRDKGDYGFMYLIDPGGIHLSDTFYFDYPWQSGDGQVHFTPDGTKYVQAFAENINFGYYLDVMDFDRCTGTFSNRKQVIHRDTLQTIGGAVSANSRYAYVAAFDEIHQYDLWSDDLEGSMEVVAIEDGFETIPGFNRLWFRAMGLGPDGKIYVSGPGTTQHLHTIHAPDSSGLDCRVGLHDIELPAYTFSTMPNLPNFRLGPVDDSSCDTLGLDNLPLARFRHTGQNKEKQFLDLSAYEPDTWHWSFGDGNTSFERQPSHRYTKSGIYKVCLTVSNFYGQDSTCRPVWVDTSLSTSNHTSIFSPVRFYPSPSEGLITLSAPADYFPCSLIITDIQGKRVHKVDRISNSQNSFSFGFLPPGTYVIQLEKKGKILLRDRWVKVGG